MTKTRTLLLTLWALVLTVLSGSPIRFSYSVMAAWSAVTDFMFPTASPQGGRL